MTMYDMRLRLSNQVVDEVRRHFQELVFDTVIHRNTRLGEAPSFGKPVVLYDAESKGAQQYMDLAREILQKNVKINWEQILGKGEKKLLEPIGNHCRGTVFLNEKNIDKEKLAIVCDEILKDFEGFNYGRFDMKVSSVSELYAGKGIQVLELNGVNADAAHIFDPNYSLFQAYSDVMWHWNRLSEISLANIKNGEKMKNH